MSKAYSTLRANETAQWLNEISAEMNKYDQQIATNFWQTQLDIDVRSVGGH
jgi:hypothetical protein